jgi:hypothetical protein
MRTAFSGFSFPYRVNVSTRFSLVMVVVAFGFSLQEKAKSITKQNEKRMRI